jgi:hypothetical protein
MNREKPQIMKGSLNEGYCDFTGRARVQGTYTLSACFNVVVFSYLITNSNFTGSMNDIQVLVLAPGGILVSNLNRETRQPGVKFLSRSSSRVVHQKQTQCTLASFMPSNFLKKSKKFPQRPPDKLAYFR